MSRIIELFDKNPGYQERHLILNFIKRLLIISINNPKLDQDPITNLIVKRLKITIKSCDSPLQGWR